MCPETRSNRVYPRQTMSRNAELNGSSCLQLFWQLIVRLLTQLRHLTPPYFFRPTRSNFRSYCLIINCIKNAFPIKKQILELLKAAKLHKLIELSRNLESNPSHLYKSYTIDLTFGELIESKLSLQSKHNEEE